MKKTKDKKDKKYVGLRKLLVYVRKNKGLFISMILLLIVGAVFGLATPILQANIISFITQGSFMTALYLIIALFAVRIIFSFQRNLEGLVYVKIDGIVKLDITNTLITAITSITMKKNDKTHTGVYIDRINNDVSKCSDVLLDLIIVFLELISNIGFLIYIAFLNIYFFIALLAYVLVLWLLDSKKEKIWFKNMKEMRDLREISTSAYNEQIRGLKDIKSLNIGKNVILDSGRKFFKTVDKGISSRYIRRKHELFKSIIAVIFEVGFIAMGLLFIKYNMISLTGFLIIYMYHGNVRMLSNYVASIKAYATEGELASRRIFEIIDEYPKESFGDIVLEDVQGDIDFQDVVFGYEEESLVLNKININFEKNKSTAIVGKSGSGKSTILSLANKLYDVNSGEILIDGININELTEDSLRDNIGIVNQSPYIFNSSIADNLRLVKAEATDEELVLALKKAEIYDFIESLPEGMSSKVGENGVMLSGGQKQRVAIARVLLKKSKIIILDEATSALDNENQSKIVKTINELKKEHTIIIVAHRLSTIIDVDKIVVIDEGKVVAEGTHKQLMKESKIYKELYQKEDDYSSINNL